MSMIRDVVKRALRGSGAGSRQAAPAAAGDTLFASGNQWYAPAIAGASTFGASMMAGPAAVRRALTVLERLTPDAYADYVMAFYRAGLERHPETWQFADINTALMTLAAGLQPRSYLEIGVRRGRSLAMVASVCPACDVLACDMFVEGYAGMDNPGPELVTSELSRVGFTGALEFLVGDSHDVLPRHFTENPDRFFDLITVDGDHSEAGARADLETVLPRLKVGGALVFDDISNPSHPELARVWRDVVESRPSYSTFAFTELGFGVGVAIRHE
jgi:predicted O-methyltransferase YrrM